MKRCQTILGLLTACAVFALILTVSIGLPIYIRPFYYAHIEAMNLPEESGFTAQQIREAYDEVLDYLTIPGRSFGTGVIPHSDSGEDHFADCRNLFFLNGGVLLGSAAVLVTVFVLCRVGKVEPLRLAGRSPSFWGALAAIVIPVVVGSLAAMDFDRAFVVFHTIFFPGKDNWIFDYNTDQIIRVLPQDFFMHCAMLIGAGVVVLSGSVLVWELVRHRKEKQWSKA